MGTNTLELVPVEDQSDILMDISDCFDWMMGYSPPTIGQINRIRGLLDKLEQTIQ